MFTFLFDYIKLRKKKSENKTFLKKNNNSGHKLNFT